MSIEAINAVFAHSTHNGHRLTVLLALASYYGQDAGEGCWPSVPTIATKCNISVETVYRALRDLRDTGEIEIWRNDGDHSGKGANPNRYYITVVCDSEFCHGSPAHKPVDNSFLIGVKSAT
jgi:hypothetical protein